MFVCTVCTVQSVQVQSDALNPACSRADVFQSVELPETIEEFLDDGVAQCIAFNRRGTLLAGKLAKVGLCAICKWRTLHHHHHLVLQPVVLTVEWSFGTLRPGAWHSAISHTGRPVCI